MNKIIILTILIVGSISCKSTKKISEKTDYIVFTFRKTECKGKCPAYYIEIYKSGKIIFEGTKNVSKIGKYNKQIAKKEVENLISEFEKANFFSFENEYTSLITDLPTTYLSFTNNGKTKQIRDYHGSPKELKDLEDKIETFANGDNWTKID